MRVSLADPAQTAVAAVNVTINVPVSSLAQYASLGSLPLPVRFARATSVRPPVRKLVPRRSPSFPCLISRRREATPGISCKSAPGGGTTLTFALPSGENGGATLSGGCPPPPGMVDNGRHPPGGAVADKPHLGGIFLAISSQAANWTLQQWTEDFERMREVGIEFVILAKLLRPINGPAPGCPVGNFTALFPMEYRCVQRANGPEGTVLVNVLAAARATGLRVHLGLASYEGLYRDGGNPWADLNETRAFASLQAAAAKTLHSLYADTGVIDGFYTEVEESNFASWLERWQPFAQHYLNPLAADIKSLNASYLASASPYNVGNLTRFTAAEILPPAFMGDLWEEILGQWAPALDVIAPQDSMGAQGNSLQNATDFLGNLSAAAARAGRRRAWSNVELFETWPPSCLWPAPCGRHPGPFPRILEQIRAEARLSTTLIAWEWSTCLSPNAAAAGVAPASASAAAANYAAYKAYLA